VEIRELRIQKNLTQSEAAKIVGIPLRTYQNYESGRTPSSFFTGKIIQERLSLYEPYSENHGILPLPLLKEKVISVLRDYPVEYAVLFGSYAKNEANEKSDVDLLISGSVDGIEFFSLVEKLRQSLHKKVDLLRFQDLKENQTLLNEILATGMRIYGK
jgi:predicted nucleotidyltransferase/DNA-binding XRE family transcriptional regulator